jgi:DNA-binding transcriptional ArsR family regulator
VRKKRYPDKGQFLRLPYFNLKHPSWRSLSGAAVRVYLELRTRYNGVNNGDLSLALEEGARLLRMAKATVQRALKELEAKGFLKMHRQGRWYGRLATTWVLTDEPYRGEPPTRDWTRLVPDEAEKQKSVSSPNMESPKTASLKKAAR